MSNNSEEKNWASKKDFLNVICEGNQEEIDRIEKKNSFFYGDMDNKHSYALVWIAGLTAGCFSLDETGLANYICDKSNNGDDSSFLIYNKELKEMSFKVNVTVEVKEKG